MRILAKPRHHLRGICWQSSFKGLTKKGQLARLLQLNRHEVRELLDGAENEESEANELVKLPQ
jgi:hypothetical protein